jgi:hypothetical protein
MKMYLTLLLFVVFIHSSIAQKIEIKDDIAYVNGKAYVKIDKKSKGKFFIYDKKTNEKLLKVKFGSSYDAMRKRNSYIVNLHFYPIKKDLLFRDVVAENEKDLLRFLYEERMFLSNKPMTKELLLEEYKRISPRSKCKRILKNDFKYIIEDQFVSVVNKDTIVLSEIKYRCTYTAFYTKKVMYDRYGKWHESVLPYSGSRHPSLIWNNIKLLNDIDKRFTVVAKGYEGMKTIYASMMIFDAAGNDMLAEDAPYKSQLIELFGFYIRNNFSRDEFYKAYWTAFDPERWKQIQNHRRHVNKSRRRSYKTQSNESKFTTPKPGYVKQQ